MSCKLLIFNLFIKLYSDKQPDRKKNNLKSTLLMLHWDYSKAIWMWLMTFRLVSDQVIGTMQTFSCLTCSGMILHVFLRLVSNWLLIKAFWRLWSVYVISFTSSCRNTQMEKYSPYRQTSCLKGKIIKKCNKVKMRT